MSAKEWNRKSTLPAAVAICSLLHAIAAAPCLAAEEPAPTSLSGKKFTAAAIQALTAVQKRCKGDAALRRLCAAPIRAAGPNTLSLYADMLEWWCEVPGKATDRIRRVRGRLDITASYDLAKLPPGGPFAQPEGTWVGHTWLTVPGTRAKMTIVSRTGDAKAHGRLVALVRREMQSAGITTELAKGAKADSRGRKMTTAAAREEARLQAAWRAIGPEDHLNMAKNKAKFAPFTLASSRQVESLCRWILGQCVYDHPYQEGQRSRADLARMKGVVAADPARGCVWLIASHSHLGARGQGAAQSAGSNLEYREWYRHLETLLKDKTVTPAGSHAKYLAPSVVWDDRLCDAAYGELTRRLLPVQQLRALAKKKGWRWPRDVRGSGAKMPYAQRDQDISWLLKLLKSPQAMAHIRSRPSALEELKKKGLLSKAAGTVKEALTELQMERVRSDLTVDDLP